MFYGLLDLSFWSYVAYTLICTHITIVAVTIFLHRHQAHRALELHPVVSHFFRLWLWLTTGMDTRAWTSIHRKHHAKCETEEDPHSPVKMGLLKVLFEGAELYRKEAKNKETLERYGQGTPDDWMELNVYRRFSAKGFLVTLFINLILLGIPGILVWAIQMSWIPFFAAGVINGIGHAKGYRNFECPDAATNISPIGILIGGEELHNNHHTFPTSAKLSYKWYEFDIGWLYIKTLSILGLAKVKRLPPKPEVITNKTVIDLDTVKSLIAARFQVIANYTHGVLVPVLNENHGDFAKSKFSTLKTYLIKDDVLLNDSAKNEMYLLLEDSAQVKLVYNFRSKLQSIWTKTAATHKELVDMLIEWCVQAEQTNIKYLQGFVSYLRQLSVSNHLA